MPPKLVLLLCTIFVLFMLRLDRKQSLEVSFTLWIPTIWMLLIFSKPLATWFQSGGMTIEEGSPLDRTFLIVLVCLGLIILLKRKLNWSRAIKENIWLMLLIGYMLVSCLWSELPFISFKRWSRELVAVVMVFIVATEPNPRKALESLFRRTIYILIPLSYVLINYFGEYGRAYFHQSGDLMWIGVTSHKNQLSQLCLLAAFYLIWALIRRWQGRDISSDRYQTCLEAFILILTFWIVGGPQHSFTYSATTTAAFALGLFALFWLSWKKKTGTTISSKVLIALIAFIIFYGTITPMVGKLSIVDISSGLGREGTLTGRTDVWKQLVPVAMKRPIIGNGFGGFWTTKNRGVYDIPGAHNGYLDVILELGFVGWMFYSIFILSSCWKAVKEMNYDFDLGCLRMCIYIMTLIHNIAESSLNSFTGRVMAVFLLLAVSSTTKSTSHTPGS